MCKCVQTMYQSDKVLRYPTICVCILVHQCEQITYEHTKKTQDPSKPKTNDAYVNISRTVGCVAECVGVGKLANKNEGKIAHPAEVADNEATCNGRHIRKINHEKTTRDIEMGATQGKRVKEKDSRSKERLWDQEKNDELMLDF